MILARDLICYLPKCRRKVRRQASTRNVSRNRIAQMFLLVNSSKAMATKFANTPCRPIGFLFFMRFCPCLLLKIQANSSSQTDDFQSDVRRFACRPKVDLSQHVISGRMLQQPTTLDFLRRFLERPFMDDLILTFVKEVHPHFPILQPDDLSVDFASIWEASTAQNPMILSLVAAVSACAVCCKGNELGQYYDCRFANSEDFMSAEEPAQPQWKRVSTYFLQLSSDILNANDYTVNIDLYSIQALLLSQYCLTIFHSDGDRASPHFWMTVNLAVSIGLHRDGSLYGLSQRDTESRRMVWVGLQIVQS